MVIWAPKSMRAGHTIILYYLYWGFFRPVNVLPCTKWLQRSIGNNMNFDKYREHWSQLGAIGVEPTSIVIRVANESLSWSTPSRKSHCRPDTDGTIYLKDWTCWSFGWPEAFHTTRDSQIDGAFSTNQGEKNTSRGVLPCLAVHCPNFLAGSIFKQHEPTSILTSLPVLRSFYGDIYFSNTPSPFLPFTSPKCSQLPVPQRNLGISSFSWSRSFKLATGFLRPTSLPIGSMSGIFTYTYHETQLNVGKCTIHGSYGLDMGHTVGGSEIR